MRGAFTLSVLFSLCFNAHAVSLSSNQSDELLKKFERAGNSLKVVSQAPECSIPSPENCSFEGYCGKLASRGQSAYLYQDSQGYSIPNFQYMRFAEAARLCGSKVSVPPSLDPFIEPSLFVDVQKAGGPENLGKNKERLAVATTRATKVVEETREKVLSMLSKRKNGKNNAQIDNIIERVKTVRIKMADPGNAAEMASSGCESPNAAYDPDMHQMVLCPQITNMPEGSLFAVVAHEFGHSFDPCSSVLDYTKDGAKFPDWMEVMVKPKSGPVIIPGIKSADNPFASAISCLQKPESINVQIPSKEKLISAMRQRGAFLNDETQEARDEEQSDDGQEDEGSASRDASQARVQDGIDNLNKYYDGYKGCAAVSQSILIDESFADWVSSQVLAEKMSTLPTEKAEEFAFASTGIFVSTACPEIATQTSDTAKALAPKCSALEKFVANTQHVESSLELPHPDTALRVNRIYFAKPEIKKALSCKGGETGTECK
ncbi:hypothetical protein DOM22_16915 [Bdellovibrio sp. ZAP7]|uniref:hypothetical protein n=1 Tax=Bdellovibrio sp. ZAP7 TaxID=2231053 RepID=UPI00115B7807|nr:hypothetical protein [Bdellovibrio sp. ZAP7]QDK46714.1 hypothetical protein DOM22_16915 [Bdellovibrio sp. ZAP7]